MQTINIHDAPMGTQVTRLGFLSGRVQVPADFDRMGAEEIAQLFGTSA